MKVLERIALILFSIIVLILAIISGLAVFQIVDLEWVATYIVNSIQNPNVAVGVVVVDCICIILAIKALFFPTRMKKREEVKSGVLLENQDGRLLISKDTIENLVNTVVRTFPDAVDTQSKIFLDMENNITVFVSLLVNENAVIKQLSADMQVKIKEVIKRNTDLDVKQVNINVKNLENEKSKANNSNKNVTKIKVEDVKVESTLTDIKP